MPAVCLYFQAHQPYRIRNISFFELGDYPEIENRKVNKHYLRLALKRSYLPVMNILDSLLNTLHEEFKFGISYTGTLLEQLKEFYPESFNIFRKVTCHPHVELISECYYHSLASFYSQREFISQAFMQKDLLQEIFGKEGVIFRNAELAYRSDLAKILYKLGFRGVIIEGCRRILKSRSPNFLYVDKLNPDFNLLVRNRKYSEYFSDFHLTGKTDPVKWAKNLAGKLNDITDDVVLLGFDLENLGEHHAYHTGIFKFFRHFVKNLIRQKNTRFMLPSELLDTCRPVGSVDIYSPVTWNGTNKDLSAWNGNIMQKEAIKYLYSIEEKIKKTDEPFLLQSWRKLQSTDHFLYLNTDEEINGRKAQYFNPFSSAHEAYVAYMNAVSSLEIYANKLLTQANLFFSK